MMDRKEVAEILEINQVESALEIMCDDGSIICSLAKQTEAIETDSVRAYLEYEKVNRKKFRRHMVFCGNPVRFLEKKIVEGTKFDIVVVNTDRLEEADAVWKQIGRLTPQKVILGYRKADRGDYNKKLMMKNGYQIIKPEVILDRDMSEKFCVGAL